MPIGLRTPYPIVKLYELHLCFFVGIFVDKLLKDVNVYKFKSRPLAHQGSVHIAQRDVHEEGINLCLVVHYLLRIIHIFVQPNVHLLRKLLGKVIACAKTLAHPNPIRLPLC